MLDLAMRETRKLEGEAPSLSPRNIRPIYHLSIHLDLEDTLKREKIDGQRVFS